MSDPNQDSTSEVKANDAQGEQASGEKTVDDKKANDAPKINDAVKKNDGDKITPSPWTKTRPVVGGSSLFDNPPPTKTASSSSSENNRATMSYMTKYSGLLEEFGWRYGPKEKLAKREDDEDKRNAKEMELRDELAHFKHGRLLQEIELEKRERMKMFEATLLSQKETELLRLQQTRVDRSIARITETGKVKEEPADDDVILLDTDYVEGPSTSSAKRENY
ncbi:hypothetical protein B9Z55_023140 [Caenorhabditis nigoni]|uniref:Uncharacterized protein n=1 Tax=Caenorhabditis nigoni TaxID=1611254 RepID=A0A2G5SNV1_9PELO|nr:hypothetical protein B9Z55_023140 [Caenorhabditis nigoni]